MAVFIIFPDRCVSYDKFMEDLSARIVRMMQRAEADPEIVSQRKAYAIFGRANVDRWRREGRVKFFKRPGKVEYRTADLRMLQETEQDYFKRNI